METEKRTDPNLMRLYALKAWMATHKLTCKNVAPELGLSMEGVAYLLRSERISCARHAEFVRLGFPIDLLPDARDVLPGPKGPRRPK